MLISELPPPYRERAEKNRGLGKDLRDWVDPESDHIGSCFLWTKTPEDYMFWLSCKDAKTPADLPPLPGTPKTEFRGSFDLHDELGKIADRYVIQVINELHEDIKKDIAGLRYDIEEDYDMGWEDALDRVLKKIQDNVEMYT